MRLSILLVLLAAVLSGFSTGGGGLTVFAAASLTDVFGELSKDVTFNFGASNELRTQIEHGAAADLFASANRKEMDKAIDAGVIDGRPVVFARNRLAVVVPAANPARIASLDDLARPGLKVVVAHSNAPVGAYTLQMLEKHGHNLKERVLRNVVSHEINVRQVVARLMLGEADAGIVYRSDVTPRTRDRLRIVEIPEPYNVVADYPIAVVKGARNPAAARRFIEMLLSEDAQQVFARHGFVRLER